MKRTHSLWNEEDSLFISYLKPQAAVTSSTISRWLKTVMCLSGIDISVYKAHSVRSASTSKAQANFIPIRDNMAVAGWKSAQTFAQYYSKEISQSDNSFAEAVILKIESMLRYVYLLT